VKAAEKDGINKETVKKAFEVNEMLV